MCLRDDNNKYSNNAIKVLSKVEKKKKESCIGKTVPEVFGQNFASWRILSMEAVINGEKRRVPEGTWVPGGGIELPCTYSIYWNGGY